MRTWVLLLLPLLRHACLSAKILGINPTPSISHQLPFLIIMRALAERGHEVTIITADPIKDPPQNVRQIDVSFTYNLWRTEIDFLKISQLSPSQATEYMTTIADKGCKVQFDSPSMQQFLKSKEKFDLVILELFLHWCYMGVVHQVGSPPLVGFASVGMYSHLHNIMGNPNNPAYSPEFSRNYTEHMNFWERLDNAILVLQNARSITNVVIPSQEKIMREYFGHGPPRISEMQHNISLLLINNHYCISYVMPLQPNIIQMTGLHIKTTQDHLPQDIQQYLDGAAHGVIYFSLGSNMRSSSLPEAKWRALVDAFSQLPQRVLWKWEEDTLPGKPSNVMISPWLPQQDILAHPNVRLFITQGGLQSFNEAAYHAVPLLGIPLFADQGYNVAKITSAGIGAKLELSEITTESVLRTVRDLLQNPGYRERMKRFSAVYREHQKTSLENGIWWVEYVLRHNGAPHLRSAALDLAWWQLLLLDVIAFLVAAIAIIFFLIYMIIRLVWPFIVPSSKQKEQ